MRFLVVGFALSILILSLGVNEITAQTEPPEVPQTPTNPFPEDGADSVLFPLTLEWDEFPGAESYFYNIFPMEEAFLVTDTTSGPLPEEILEFLSPKPYEDYQRQCEGTCSDEDIQRIIVEKQTYFWRVKSCTVPSPSNPDDASCGPYSDPPWSFIYIPPPPENLQQPSPDSSGVTLPVKLVWTEVENVGSYLIDVQIDVGGTCSNWNHVVGFFLGGDCDPFNFIIDPIDNAFVNALSWVGVTLGDQYDPSCPWLLWNSDTKECFTLPIAPLAEQDEAEPEYLDDGCVFSKNAPYLITIASCLDKQARVCGEWSEQWSFSTGEKTAQGTPYTLSAPKLLEPEYDPEKPPPVVGKTHLLGWKGGACGGYVHLFVHSEGTLILDTIIPNFDAITLSENKMEELWDEPSDLNKEYVWSLQPCWRIKDDIQCETNVSSEEWHFKTIGKAPLLENPGNNELIKVLGTLSWQHIDGVGSYLIQIARDAAFAGEIVKEASKISSFILSLEKFEPGKQYWWRVAACADEEADVCGEWSNTFGFRTHDLNPPTDLTPGDEEKFSLPGTLKWEPDDGANYYQYQISYTAIAQDETLEECNEKLQQQQLFQPPYPIVSAPSFFLNERCAGTYEWAVRSCADRSCILATAWQDSSPPWKFTGVEPIGAGGLGLVPCGKLTSNDATPYDERESCQFKHIGFLLQNILDFVLWKLSLIILAALAVFVGASTYFSFGSPDTLTRIRAVFRSYFYGVLLLLFAWAIVNIIMVVFGFNIEFFGRWWELPF